MADKDATGLTAADAEGGGEPAAAPAAPKAKPNICRGGSRDPQVFVLLRELSEVHLLLDNVSANSATTVAEPTAGTTLPKGLGDDWIEKVCEISWPPDGSNEERATDAALLIRAKDYLNRLSHPASGSTIAFTLLVTQEDAPRWWSRYAFLWRGGGSRESASPPNSPTRTSLARAAYPDLVGKAEGFRRAIWWISMGLVLTLLLTCAISWYVAYGNAALAELATAREAFTKAEERVNTAESQQTEAPDEGGQPAAAAPAAAPVAAPVATPAGTQAETTVRAASPTPAAFVGYCANVPYQSATQAQVCEARARAENNIGLVERRLASWLCWEWFSNCSDEAKVADAPSRSAAFATIMGSAVLPFLYGLLGAGAAIIRSLSRKIRESRLSPRDLHLSFQQLALGAVVGACIGLFVSAPDSGETGESLLGPVTLSASAISFVAGFGVEAVFQALEALITRIFNITAAPTGNRGDGSPGN
jgi:hypothetical protein